MTDLIQPVTPELINPEPHPPIAGNYADDDGQAIDEWFEAAPVGPQEYGIPPVITTPTIPQTTRLLTREFVISANGGVHTPILVLPADPNRIKLIIGVEADTRIASEKSDVFSAAPAGGTAMLDMDGHTGAVWAYSTDTATDLVVRAWSITS